MPATPAWPPESLPRLFVETPLAEGARIDLPKAQAHYVATVMRRQPGDALLLFDGRNGEWRAEIVETSKRSVTLAVGARTRPQEETVALTLAFAPVKRQRMDFLIEKAVELGAAHLQPVITRRTIVDKVNLDKARAHIVEAAEQCGRTALATIAAPVKLDRWLMERYGAEPLFFADEAGGEPALHAFAAPPATILTGPEGGFTDEERAAIRGAPGAVAITLGPRILRAETAALAAIATYMARFGG